jgi:hypothetical protein
LGRASDVDHHENVTVRIGISAVSVIGKYRKQDSAGSLIYGEGVIASDGEGIRLSLAGIGGIVARTVCRRVLGRWQRRIVGPATPRGAARAQDQ